MGMMDKSVAEMFRQDEKTQESCMPMQPLGKPMNCEGAQKSTVIAEINRAHPRRDGVQLALWIHWPYSEGQIDFCGGQNLYTLRHENDQDSPTIKFAGVGDGLSGNA